MHAMLGVPAGGEYVPAWQFEQLDAPLLALCVPPPHAMHEEADPAPAMLLAVPAGQG